MESTSPGTPGSIPSFPPQTRQKSPSLAFLLSLVLPGLSQFYCGKVKRGLYTLIFFVLALSGVVFLYPLLMESDDPRMAFFWGGVLRAALVLYVFAFLDAYFTAKEINAGVDPQVAKNPRVAAVLNLLTRGFGYWYVGEKKKGILLFILVGAVSRVALNVDSELLSNVLSLLVEVALASMAVDAYRIARNRLRERLEAASLPPAPMQPVAGLSPAVPLGLAGLLALGYVGLVALGFVMPDYSVVDQSAATITEAKEGKDYANATYGIALHVPPGWEFDQSDPEEFVSAIVFNGACRVSFLPEAAFPFLALTDASDSLTEQILAQYSNFHLREEKPATLASLPAREVVFSADVEGTEVVQHYFVAKQGFTLYWFVTTVADPFTEVCQEDFETIRQGLVLPP